MSGMVDGTRSNNGVIGLQNQIYAYCHGNDNDYEGGAYVRFNAIRKGNGFSFQNSSGSEDANSYKIIPRQSGTYLIDLRLNLINEPPTGSEDDSGKMIIYWHNNSSYQNVTDCWIHWKIDSNPTSAHEGQSWTASWIQDVTNVGSSGYHWVIALDGMSQGNYNEKWWVFIQRLSPCIPPFAS